MNEIFEIYENWTVGMELGHHGFCWCRRMAWKNPFQDAVVDVSRKDPGQQEPIFQPCVCN